MAVIRAKYRAHIAAILKRSGVTESDARAARIFDLERRIAEVHSSRVDTSDVLKGNNHWSREDFQARAPGLDWQAFFAAAALDKQNHFVVWQPGAVIGISVLVRNQPLASWKDYLTFHAVAHVGNFLPKAFVDERFNFLGKLLTGTPALRELCKRAV